MKANMNPVRGPEMAGERDVEGTILENYDNPLAVDP